MVRKLCSWYLQLVKQHLRFREHPVSFIDMPKITIGSGVCGLLNVGRHAQSWPPVIRKLKDGLERASCLNFTGAKAQAKVGFPSPMLNVENHEVKLGSLVISNRNSGIGPAMSSTTFQHMSVIMIGEKMQYSHSRYVRYDFNREQPFDESVKVSRNQNYKMNGVGGSREYRAGIWPACSTYTYRSA
jgi:hypothetical protein